MTEKNNTLLWAAGPWRVDQENHDGETISRIELRTDGHGVSGFYDMIYIYTEGDDRPWLAFPAHQCDAWEYLRA